MIQEAKNKITAEVEDLDVETKEIDSAMAEAIAECICSEILISEGNAEKILAKKNSIKKLNDAMWCAAKKINSEELKKVSTEQATACLFSMFTSDLALAERHATAEVRRCVDRMVDNKRGSVVMPSTIVIPLIKAYYGIEPEEADTTPAVIAPTENAPKQSRFRRISL